MSGSGKDCALFVPVGGLRSLLQFVVHLVQKFLGLLRVALHIPLVGLLCVHDSLISLRAQPLRRRQVRVAARGNILRRPLGKGQTSEQEEGSQEQPEEFCFRHGAYSINRTAPVQ